MKTQLKMITISALMIGGVALFMLGKQQTTYRARHGIATIDQHVFTNQPSIRILGDWQYRNPKAANSPDKGRRNEWVDLNHISLTTLPDSPDPLAKPTRLRMGLILPKTRPELSLLIPAHSAIKRIVVTDPATDRPIFDTDLTASPQFGFHIIPIPTQHSQKLLCELQVNTLRLRDKLTPFQLSLLTRSTLVTKGIQDPFPNLSVQWGMLTILVIFQILRLLTSHNTRRDYLVLAISGLIAFYQGIVSLAPQPSQLSLYGQTRLLILNACLIIIATYGLLTRNTPTTPRQTKLKRSIWILWGGLFGYSFLPVTHAYQLGLWLPVGLTLTVTALMGWQLAQTQFHLAAAISLLATGLLSLSWIMELNGIHDGLIPSWTFIGYILLLSLIHEIAIFTSKLTELTRFNIIDHHRLAFFHDLLTRLRSDLGNCRQAIEPQLKELKGHHHFTEGSAPENYLQAAVQTLEIAHSIMDRSYYPPSPHPCKLTAQEIFDDAVNLIQTKLHSQDKIQFHATHNWADHPAELVIDRELFNFLIYEITCGLIETTPYDQKNHITLDFHYDSETFKLSVTLRDQIGNSDFKKPDQERLLNNLDQHDHPYFHQRLAFCDRLMLSLNGSLRIDQLRHAGRLIYLTLLTHDGNPLPAPSVNDSRWWFRQNTEVPAAEPALARHNQSLSPTNDDVVRALIVTTESGSYELLASNLQTIGISSRWARHHRQVTTMLKADSYQLLVFLVDNQFTEDLNLISSIRQEVENDDLMIMVFSAYQNSEWRQQCLQAGVDDFLVQPIGFQELQARVHTRWHRTRKILALQKKREDRHLTQQFERTLLNQVPKIPGARIDTHHYPAATCGGDWVQVFYDERHHRLYAVIGEVSGSGHAASLIAGTAVGAFRAITHRLALDIHPRPMDQCLKQLIVGLNESIFDSLQQAERFMHATFLSIDMTTGDTLYSNSGSHPTYLVSEHKLEPLLIAGEAFGVNSDTKLTYKRLSLSPDTALFVYTDGLIANPSIENANFNQTTLESLLSNPEVLRTKSLATTILDEAKKRWASQTLEDDCTILVINWSHATNPMFADDESA
jgi:serine phosphatase RsbU (regulator of sigma subunit)